MVARLMTKIGEHDRQIVQRDETIARKDREILYRQTKIDLLTHEMAVLKRWKFGRSSSTRPRPACSMRPSMPTSRPSIWNCKR